MRLEQLAPNPAGFVSCFAEFISSFFAFSDFTNFPNIFESGKIQEFCGSKGLFLVKRILTFATFVLLGG